MHKPGEPNGIHWQIRMDLAPIFTDPLASSFTKSLETSDISTDWKVVNITSICTKGTRHDAANYRLVSLASICYKSMKRFVRDIILAHLVNN